MNGKQLGVLVCGIGAMLAGLGAEAYHLFAPTIGQGTTCQTPQACAQALAAPPPVATYSYAQLSFSFGWGIFFSVLALAIVGIGLCAVAFARSQRRLWAWILAALTLGYTATTYLLVDTSGFGLSQQNGLAGNLAHNVYFSPGAALALVAVVLAFLPQAPQARRLAPAAR